MDRGTKVPGMPILRGAPSLVRFRVVEARALAEGSTPAVLEGLRAGSFRPLDRSKGDEERSAGWVELDDPDGTDLAPAAVLLDGDLLLSWRIDQVRVPAALVRTELSVWAAAFAERKGRRPSAREKAEGKEVVLRRLRKQAFVTTRLHDVRWRLAAGEIEVWATARKVIDEIAVALEEGVGVVLRPLGPGTRWEDAGLAVDGLRPTPELFGEEVARGL